MFRAVDIQKLIDRFGKIVTLNSKTNGTYNTTTGAVTRVSTPQSIKAYFYDIRKENEFDTTAIEGQRRVAIPAKDIAGNPVNYPDVGDTIVGHRKLATVTRVDEVLSGTTTICYLLRVRQ